jgi:hypothetical protein
MPASIIIIVIIIRKPVINPLANPRVDHPAPAPKIQFKITRFLLIRAIILKHIQPASSIHPNKGKNRIPILVESAQSLVS